MNPFEGAQRPVIILGHGVRLSGAAEMVPAIMNLGVPVLTSWQAADLCDYDHPNYFGRPGVYGQRCANHVLANADLVLSIGCRLSQWVTGYNPLPGRIVMVDIDGDEVGKIKGAEWINEDAKAFIGQPRGRFDVSGWLDVCNGWRSAHPWLEAGTHDDTTAINSYRFLDALQENFQPDEVIVTDAGSFMCPAFQVLKLRTPMRLMTSGGLGEMGCALPFAVGASIARDKGRVICLVGDGGLMMNMQELATIATHRLPVKIFVFDNGGYGMIRATQDVLGLKRVGVGTNSGLGFPNFRYLAKAFGIDGVEVRTWDDYYRVIGWMFKSDGPALCHYVMDAEQKALPKLNPIIVADGSITSPTLDQLSPVLP